MPLAIVRTNLQENQIPQNMLQDMHQYLMDKMGYDEQLVMLELHTNISMLRGGNQDPIVNVEFHHNDDAIKEDTKRDKAAVIANFIVEQVNIDISRVLVLFFDTRCTTEQSTQF